MKRKLNIMALLMCFCYTGLAADGLRIEPFEIQPGETGKEVAVVLDDANGIYTGVEFWLSLPEGIAVSTDEYGDCMVEPSAAAMRHTFDISRTADGSYHFLVYSTSLRLLGNGVLCTLTLEASTTAAPGTATGSLKSVVLSDANGQGPEFDEIPFTVTVAAPAPEVIPVAIGSMRLATLYYAGKALTVPEGVAAYVVTQADVDDGFSGWKATYGEGDVIPAGEAVVVSGEPGTYELTVAAGGGAPADGNLLRGYDAATDESAMTVGEGDGDYRYYMLSTDEDGDNVGFYYGNDEGMAFECENHRAYLALPTANAARCYPLDIEQLASGIDSATRDNAHSSTFNAQWHSLDGRRLNGRPMRKGIYIRNGRKEVVR